MKLIPVGSGDLFGIFISEEVGILGYVTMRDQGSSAHRRMVQAKIISLQRHQTVPVPVPVPVPVRNRAAAFFPLIC